MGFCLFREADFPDYYFAVNPSHVESLEVRGHVLPPLCHLKFKFSTGNFVPLTSSGYDEVTRMLHQGAKIGLKKVEGLALSATSKSAGPLLLNNPDRVALVRELPANEIKSSSESAVVSCMFFADGTSRFIAGRPGTFAFLANAGGEVPGA